MILLPKSLPLLIFLFHLTNGKGSSSSSRGSSGSRSGGSYSSGGSSSYSSNSYYYGSSGGGSGSGDLIVSVLLIIGVCIFVCVMSYCCKQCEQNAASTEKPTHPLQSGNTTATNNFKV